MTNTPSSTKTSDDFLTEVLGLTSEYFEAELDSRIVQAKNYVSELNFHSMSEFKLIDERWTKFAARVSELSGIQDNPCRLSSIRFCPDPYTGFWNFIVERKIEAAFDKQGWYSLASIPTPAHLSLLEEFEQLLPRSS